MTTVTAEISLSTQVVCDAPRVLSNAEKQALFDFLIGKCNQYEMVDMIANCRYKSHLIAAFQSVTETDSQQDE